MAVSLGQHAAIGGPAGESGIPNEVQQFLENLYDYLYARDVDKVTRLYEQDYVTLSEQYYSNQLWPSFEDVVQYYRQANKEHQLILILYQELFYRHAFARLVDKVTWEYRLGSWQNYSLFFEFLADSQCKQSDEPALCLPAQWLWDMFEEFCYQFRDTQWRKWQLIRSIRDEASPIRTPEEDEVLASLWDPKTALKFLYLFVKKSDINEALSHGTFSNMSSIGRIPLRYQIGYFASIALLRLNNLFCDYHHALECVKNVPLGAKALSWSIPSCHVNLHYHVTFAQLMMKQYQEAAKTASYVLSLTTRSRPYLQGSNTVYQKQPSLEKNVDQLSLITLICNALSPEVKVDDFIMSRISDQFKNDYYRLNSQLDSEEPILEAFKKVLPPFVSAAIWDQNLKAPLIDIQQTSEIFSRQIALFAKNIGHQKRVNQLLSFAKLYHNVSLPKLATLVGMMESPASEAETKRIKEVVRAELLSVKSLASSMALDFVVDEDIVHVMPLKSDETYADQYGKQRARIKELTSHVQSLDVSRLFASSSSAVEAV